METKENNQQKQTDEGNLNQPVIENKYFFQKPPVQLPLTNKQNLSVKPDNYPDPTHTVDKHAALPKPPQ